VSFVSVEFFLLLVITLSVLVLVPSGVGRKVVVLLTSCVFYAFWDWRFLGLLAAVTVIDFYISQELVAAKSARKRKLLLVASVATNLGLLAVFKYLGFFLDSLNALLLPLGMQLGVIRLILPIGISFYTFETLSYVIDVYRRQTQPARSLLDYAVFVTFFPRLVAGPIMRASTFLPQLAPGIQLSIDNLGLGLQLFLRGMVKKLVVADTMAIFVDQVYASPTLFSSSTVWLAAAAYSIQILCDFSGYTDMALGIGQALGIQLPENFNLPYTSQSIREFWQRWHISLSTWLRDYLYISLGGSRRSAVRTNVNLMVTMLLGGLWHGASWNFVLWGGLNGLYLVVERIFRKHARDSGEWVGPLSWLRAGLVFVVVTITWVPFRSPSYQVTIDVFKKLSFIGDRGIVWLYQPALLAVFGCLIGGFVLRTLQLRLEVFPLRRGYTFAVILAMALLVFYLSPLRSSPFIYFQF
jgi:alginate O-acetyltransferase complex protein AlgI